MMVAPPPQTLPRPALECLRFSSISHHLCTYCYHQLCDCYQKDISQGCEKTRKCQVVASYAPEKLNYVFEMKGLSNGYISLGLSRDARMGEDLTTSCLIQGNGQVDIVSGYNKGYSGNKNIPRKDKKDGIEERMKNSVRDGWISCSWKRRREVTVEGQDWNLGREKFHIMLAQGTVTEGRLVKHRAKVISGDSRGLGEPGLVQANHLNFYQYLFIDVFHKQ